MNRVNQLLITEEPVEVQDIEKTTDRFEGKYETIPSNQ